MNMVFSEESTLLIRNWHVVREIHEAEGLLAAALRDYLYGLEERLRQRPWWDDGWVFVRRQEVQVYLSRTEWQRDGDFLVWIGVENVTVESVFGTEGFPSCYVWSLRKDAALIQRLRRVMADEPDLMGDIETKGNNCYILRHPLRKCLPDELDHFDEVVGAPLLAFFDCYGRKAPLISATIEAEANE